MRKFSMARILATVATLALLLASGCVSPLVVPGNSGGNTTTGGKLYVSTPTSILRFGNALSANGNVAPEAIITGAATELSSPARIQIDTTTDRLFVANRGGASVLIFSTASTMSGSPAPAAVLTSTGNIVSPVDVAIDTTNNLLYVADGQNILVFSGEAALAGTVNTPPVSTVTFTFSIGAIFLDADSNTLFIADPADNAVDILPGASTATGAGALLVSPITGSSTLLATPNGMALDGAGRLIVSNTTAPASLTIFPASIIPGGDPNITAPAAVITGSATRLGTPGEMAFNGSAGTSGELYVADSTAPGILIYLNIGAASATINLIPNRTLVGSATNLNANAVNGMALDTTR
jgi:hypothetical protein